jgi:hypothetical protein
MRPNYWKLTVLSVLGLAIATGYAFGLYWAYEGHLAYTYLSAQIGTVGPNKQPLTRRDFLDLAIANASAPSPAPTSPPPPAPAKQ